MVSLPLYPLKNLGLNLEDAHLRLGSPEADSETRMWVHLVYLGCNPRKPGGGEWRRSGKGRQRHEESLLWAPGSVPLGKMSQDMGCFTERRKGGVLVHQRQPSPPGAASLLSASVYGTLRPPDTEFSLAE